MSFSFLQNKRKMRRFLGYAILAFGFLALWSALTIAILFLQDTFLSEEDVPSPRRKERSGGLQVIVGHYNGNLPEEKLRNLTDEDLNANNFSPIADWGEGGKGVRLGKEENKVADETFGINKFNLYVSDRIPLNRTLPDVRKPSCRELSYPEPSELPTTSVIIVYHNEAYSTLLRTVWSVINRSSRENLAEIILVDDFSNRTFLLKALDDAVREMPIRVKIIRARQRVGLIRARMMGAQEARGDVLTFLDSHCECTKGWLEPLLARIKENRKNVVCPVIDVINDDTFQYQKGIELFRGGFNWNLQFRWYGMPTEMAKERVKKPTEPIESPTMAGGLFSIDRRYFEELGTYDHGMDIWGGENLEISFRIWQCGGRVEILPCSHVGHIFRKTSPHDFPGKSSGKILNNNLFRVAEVWMDEWKHLFYKIAPQAGHLRKEVDVSERVELRKRLNCKSFRWYLENVFIDHFLPTKSDFFGRIKNKHCLGWNIGSNGLKQPHDSPCDSFFDHKQIHSLGLCLVSRPGQDGNTRQHKLITRKCTLGTDIWQLWLWTRDGRIRSDEHLCLSATQVVHTNGEWIVQLKECSGYENEYWRREGRLFVHKESGQCLTSPQMNEIASTTDLNPPMMRKCGKGDQDWELKPLHWREEESSSLPSS